MLAVKVDRQRFAVDKGSCRFLALRIQNDHSVVIRLVNSFLQAVIRGIGATNARNDRLRNDCKEIIADISAPHIASSRVPT